MCQFSGTVLEARQKKKHNETSRNLFERPLSSFMFWIDLSWNELRAVLKLTWPLLESLEGENSAVLAFFAGSHNANVGKI